MIEVDEGNLIKISNWEKHQNIEGMEKVREQTRKRVANHRSKQKALIEPAKEETCGNKSSNVTCNVTKTLTNATEEEEDKEEEIEEDNSLLYLENIVEHYCLKAGMLSVNFKPKEFDTVKELLANKIPVDVIKKGIDSAFKDYKPSFQGEKISSFNYCKPVVLKLWNNINAKKKGVKKDGSTRSSVEDELREQGIGL
jgi:hypothetical protein